MHDKDVAKQSNRQRKIEAVDSDVHVEEVHEEGTSDQSDVIRHRKKKSICNKVKEERRMCKEADGIVGKEESVDGSKTIQPLVNGTVRGRGAFWCC